MAVPEDERRARRRRDTLIRQRRRRALAIVVVAAVALAVVAVLLTRSGDGGGGDNAPVAPADPLEGLSDGQIAGQHLIAGFDGTRIPDGLERLAGSGRLAGVILFADNISTRSATAHAIAKLQALERPAGLTQPLAVMVDQEGGSVRRVDGPPTASAAEMGERGRAYATSQGRRAATSLLSYGINVDLAPVLDLARPGSAIAAEGRSFGAEPSRVSDVGVGGFAAGLRSKGVAATAKHFPGLGGAATNTDLAAESIESSRAELRAADEVPFQVFADDGGELIMLGLASYPAFGDRPAAFDPAVATGELRDRIGFEGVTITDSLDAAAARAYGGRDEGALAATSAGSDLLLYGDWRTAREIGRKLTARLDSGKLDRPAFEDATSRVLELRAGLPSGR